MYVHMCIRMVCTVQNTYVHTLCRRTTFLFFKEISSCCSLGSKWKLLFCFLRWENANWRFLFFDNFNFLVTNPCTFVCLCVHVWARENTCESGCVLVEQQRIGKKTGAAFLSCQHQLWMQRRFSQNRLCFSVATSWPRFPAKLNKRLCEYYFCVKCYFSFYLKTRVWRGGDIVENGFQANWLDHRLSRSIYKEFKKGNDTQLKGGGSHACQYSWIEVPNNFFY